MKELLNVVVLALSFLALFALGEVLYHYLKIGVEWTRKCVHIGTGVLTLLFPILLQNHWLVLVLCASFAIILFLSLRFNMLKSINAIERKSWGSLYYPLSVYCCFLIYQWFEQHYHAPYALLIFYIPILLLAICDPLATYFGSNFPLKKFTLNAGTKSMGGALGFICGAILVTTTAFLVFQITFDAYFVLSVLFISISTTTAEFFGSKGSDNLFIPFTGILATLVSFLYLLNHA